MALIKCPECGRENVSDSAEACPNCGYGVKAHYIKKREDERIRLKNEEQERINIEEKQCRIKENNLKKEKANKKKELAKKIVKKSSPLIIIIVIAIIVSCIYLVKIGKKEYREAISYFKKGNYEEALSIFESLENYRDSNEYIEKCKVNITVGKYNNQNYIQAYNELVLLSSEVFERVMNDSTISLEDMLNDCQKNCADLGHIAFTEKNYSKASDYFEICYEYNSISYKNEYLFTEKFPTLNTTWYYFPHEHETYEGWLYIGEDKIQLLGIFGMKGEYYDYEVQGSASIYIPDLKIYMFLTDDGGLNVHQMGMGPYYILYDNPHKNESKAPAIGMTAEEVKESTWGTPKEINKTTYEWGITEQWVYSGYRYIYFENGKVTSISE